MSERRPLIAGNWKMYKTGPEAAATARSLVDQVRKAADVDIMIAPPFTALASVLPEIRDTNIALGAQNVHWEAEGAYTGEIAPAMLKAAGCRYVIIGHSERRQFFGETDQTVNRKVRAVINQGLVPVFCIGETESQREARETFSVLDKQVKMGLEEVFLEGPEALVMAYEPVWAIGTGKTATAAEAQEVHAFLRERINDIWGQALSSAIRILYGGSVKPDNVSELMAMPDVDGALVGGASLKPEVFAEIVLYQKD